MNDLEEWQKEANAEYFQQIIDLIADYYIWKDRGFRYRVIDGKLLGSTEGIEAIEEITPLSFHKKLQKDR